MRGDRLKRALQKAKMYNKDVAARIGVSAAAVSRWVAEINEPDDETKCRLADILGVTVAFLMGEDAPSEFYGGVELPGGSIRIPVLSRASIACGGHGNGGVDGILQEAEEYLTMAKND
jgi:transcriptional regulator with XRE-family HTH domain